MTTRLTAAEPIEEEVGRLMWEIERYLEAVRAFRAEGVEPRWLDDEALPDWWLEEMCPHPVPATTDGPT